MGTVKPLVSVDFNLPLPKKEIAMETEIRYSTQPQPQVPALNAGIRF
jgi:hypothetical protein